MKVYDAVFVKRSDLLSYRFENGAINPPTNYQERTSEEEAETFAPIKQEIAILKSDRFIF